MTPDTMPWMLASVAVIGAAAAVSLVALAVLVPPLWRELRDVFRDEPVVVVRLADWKAKKAQR